MIARVRVLSVGKTKEKWLSQAIDEYITRLRARIDLECAWVRDDDALVSAARASGGGTTILLDERGSALTSVDFSKVLFKALERGGNRATFVIGAADGLPAELKDDHSYELLSLSRLTLTHQMARLLLVEQIYRGSEIARGSKYHRE